MSTDQQSLIQGDVASQMRFALQAIISDAVRLLCEPSTGLWAGNQPEQERVLALLRAAADELRLLGEEEPVPF